MNNPIHVNKNLQKEENKKVWNKNKKKGKKIDLKLNKTRPDLKIIEQETIVTIKSENRSEIEAAMKACDGDKKYRDESERSNKDDLSILSLKIILTHPKARRDSYCKPES